MYEVLIEKKFSSAHYLRNYHGADEPLHGHNWKVQVKFRGKKLMVPEEYLCDFVEMHSFLDQVIGKISYKNLNDLEFFKKMNPSAENIARWIYEELAKLLPSDPPYSVTVWETEDGAASFIAEE
ncbi:MAG: hypothetical protein A3I11_00570 [Elusimicrobia bacterium RIFCSPLOWO2_02_FULL_39_32]|nr:MAG: hypothetical protein A2034_03105 [Elusimicrobia bacterium GWA2_38_7]OGR78944.1 MAG: hypothetical protein A3B80_07595 [Elusimicrobia bacterium RIFCSPHIGHO2_02_FULL_39_36]OGR92528.1 MAG: hypothetical protein A3I11_00570 [Elusimicrobia bacterium RIFCSPLOWO2_02_FULL_39_32]OGR99176.1 MAG: hypothetical protein A3G85_05780 [Elusimicrobia bacterium RIFCSPLOWO2_12_FULL_39_28]